MDFKKMESQSLLALDLIYDLALRNQQQYKETAASWKKMFFLLSVGAFLQRSQLQGAVSSRHQYLGFMYLSRLLNTQLVR